MVRLNPNNWHVVPHCDIVSVKSLRAVQALQDQTWCGSCWNIPDHRNFHPAEASIQSAGGAWYQCQQATEAFDVCESRWEKHKSWNGLDCAKHHNGYPLQGKDVVSPNQLFSRPASLCMPTKQATCHCNYTSRGCWIMQRRWFGLTSCLQIPVSQ